MPNPAWDYNFTLGEEWYVSDPNSDTRPQTTAAEVDDRIAANPDLAPYRDWLIEMLLSFAKEAEGQGALIDATYWQQWDGVPVAAHIRTFDGKREVPDSVEGELDALMRWLPERQEGDLRDREVKVVDLPAGRAVRMHVLGEAGQDEDGKTIVLEVVEYWVPIPGHPDMIVIVCTTPTLVHGEELVEAFDTIAATLELQP